MSIETTNYTISREQSKRASYLKTLHDEIALWGSVDESDLNGLRINQPKILAYRKRMMGQDGPVRDFADWTDFLISEYGPRKRCLSLGSGVGRVEKHLVQTGFAQAMGTLELCAEANEPVRLKDSRIDVQIADLNFMQLPPNTYDFILCHCTLHHLINLEHILHMVNSSLKANGLFLVYEFVGDTRWQFTKERLDFIRRMFPEQVFERPSLWTIEGFESIRSGDILALLEKQFGDSCKRSAGFAGIYFPFIECGRPKTDAQIDKVIELDERVTNEGIFSPCYFMGLYGKSNRPRIEATRWSNVELDSRLMPSIPLSICVRRALGNSVAGPFLRQVKKAISR